MKSITNIIFSIALIFSVAIFSSFKTYSDNQEVKKEVKKEKKEDKEKKAEVISLEYEATVTSGVMFSPLDFIKVVVDTFVTVSDDEWFEFNFELKSQEFYRIFFTHIISKNAP